MPYINFFDICQVPESPSSREEFLLVNYIQLVYIVLHIARKMFPSVICPVFQASYKFDPELFLNSESQLKFLNERMWKTAYDAYRYSYAVVLVVGILGNILVIISILRQKKLLRNNYHFLVLHLAICDLGPLIIPLFGHINRYFVKDRPVITSTYYCVFIHIYYVFRVAGIGMMLIISLLRYRATVHPLKPDVSRRKLKVVCGLVYIVGFIAGYGTYLPLCFMQRTSDVAIVYNKVYNGYIVSCFYFFPTIFMAVVYYKIGRELIKQNRYMKSVRSNPVSWRGAPDSSFNILKFLRNRRTFFVCLITVLCYGIGNIPASVRYILFIAGENHFLLKYVWIKYLANVLRVVGSHSVNPLIYGRLDKRLLPFWKLCRKKKQRNHKETDWTVLVAS
jgi:hypothetical protein